ncbi:hypothetical protein ABIA39_000146 [Nocardia sp. GAS34]|uniref:hypothetical protein n=1 Tax=unclassified Nocardia TaxID=2637762 RepID=UPI003D206BCA
MHSSDAPLATRGTTRGIVVQVDTVILGNLALMLSVQSATITAIDPSKAASDAASAMKDTATGAAAEGLAGPILAGYAQIAHTIEHMSFACGAGIKDYHAMDTENSTALQKYDRGAA